MSKTVLIKPILTEKITKLTKTQGKYGFEVGLDANKIEIKQAVQQMYGVTVEAVNTMVRPRKVRSRYTKAGVVSGQTNLTKKAIVTLSKGDSIDFFAGVSDE